MCPYALFSLQTTTSGSAQRSPSPKRTRAKARVGVAVNGGLAFGCTNRATAFASLVARAPYEASRCDANRDVRSRTRRRVDHRYARRASAPRAGPSRAQARRGTRHPPPKGGARGTDHGIAARRGGARAPWSLSEEGASDRGKCRRFTTSVWKRSRRASRNRRRAHHENARRLSPVSAMFATGVSEARSFVVRVRRVPPTRCGKGRTGPHGLRRSAEAAGAS